MQFDLVSPERELASMDAASVQIPGADGDMTVMADHAPTITTLRPGVLRVEVGGNTHEYVVTGGFAEIGTQGVSVLAERAVAKTDMTQDDMDAMFDEVQDAYNRAKQAADGNSGPVDDAAKLMADIVAVGSEIGLSTKSPSL
ncbi:F0F1 ATP synthase subunit epsilon [Tateyamaria sp. Alg231-49]|uniref:F0F1 ATP synthase subunit epsilon n=1 Tax=Tateyamaria sp. Alg231-49 TaxID=1922219 RepID=UPI000D561FF0|nr:F0F1 ATP synthase subunit epsilon [Tateyamaria sp. Alg231-49]